MSADPGSDTGAPTASELMARPVEDVGYAAELDAIFTSIGRSHPDTNFDTVRKAFVVAEYYHRRQRRASGGAYIFHPLAVAKIVADLGLNEPAVVAALLHDTVEDTTYTLEQMTEDFSAEVAHLVDGVTKLDKRLFGEMAKAETIRKIIVAMFQDIRVVVIKLADRLHNMRTIGSLTPEQQNRIAKETLDIYAPLSHRLGMNTVKWELEDLAFSTLQPKIYNQIVQQVAAEQPAREKILQEIIPVALESLESRNVQARIYGRPKHYYSIYQKMVVRGRDFTDIYDLLGIRVLVGSENDCYLALAAIHALWQPLPGRFKDYIVNPKYSTYQSLHTTVVGPQGKPVEFQIRTREMHRNAEYGVAAHWKYKKNPTGKHRGSKLDPMDLLWVKRLSQWQSEEDDPSVFLDYLTADLAAKEVMVFSPNSDLYFLPQGATPVDFAYSIHTEVGHHCIGARINGKLVRLDTALSDGDVCEILTTKSPDAGPSRDWLDFVKSPRARQKINQFFSKERRDLSIDAGKDALAKQLRHSGLPLQRILTLPYLTAVASKLRYADVPALYAAVGESKVGAQRVVDQLIALEGGKEDAAEESFEDRSLFSTGRRHYQQGLNSGVAVEGDSDVLVKLAQCCTPVPGDQIIGFVTRSQGVSVHRRDCRNVRDLLNTPERILTVTWTANTHVSYLVTISVEGLDRVGLLADITAVLTEDKVSIISAQVQVAKDRTTRMTLSFEIPDPSFLNQVIKKVRGVREVTEVRRVNA